MSSCRFSVPGIILLSAILIVSCSEQTETSPADSRPTQGEVVANMLEVLGGEEALRAVDSLVLKGNGTRLYFGQIPATGADDPMGTLTNLTETIDLANGQAAFDNNILIEGGFAQQRTEVLTHYKNTLMSWGTTGGRPAHATSVNGIFSWASHNSPEFLLRRNVITVALAGLDADPDMSARSVIIDGKNVVEIVTTLNGEAIELFVDQNTGLLNGWHAIDTESMRGDTDALYLVDDYRAVDTLLLPFSLKIEKDAGTYLELTYDSIALNAADESLFEIPGEIIDQAEAVVASDGSWTYLDWNEVAPGVVHIVAFSHHSMVVEFPDYVVVVEGAYTEGQSLTLVNMIQERIGKPIRYVAPTHPHYDHTGGVRGFASVGASVLVAAGHEDELRMIVESPHSNPPDALARRLLEGAEVGQVEVYSGSTEITDGNQTLQLFEVSGIPHVEPMVLAYVPGQGGEPGVLFQSDLFFGGGGPDAEALYRAIIQRGLNVGQIVGGHGGVLPFSALEEAVNQQDAVETQE